MNIKELAEQAGMSNTLGCFWQCGDHDLERFAELVAAAEREACAKLCDDMSEDVMRFEYWQTHALELCAEAIRARGDSK